MRCQTMTLEMSPDLLPQMVCRAVQHSLDTTLAQIERLLCMDADMLDSRIDARLRLVRSHLWQMQDVMREDWS